MLRSFPYLLVLFLSLALLGCGKRTTIVGAWTLEMPPAVMELDFDEKGSYSGNMTRPMPAQVKGTYKVEGDTLVMQPPTVTGPGGTTVPSGGEMRLKMTPQGENVIQLFDGNRNLVMTRRGSAPR